MEEPLIIEVEQRAGHVLVTVAGELDMDTVPRLRERLAALAVGGQPIVVDLDRVSYIGAAGLGVLADAAVLARAHGGSLHVAAPARIRRLFALTGLDQHIPLAGTLAEAMYSAVRPRLGPAGPWEPAAPRPPQPVPAPCRAPADGSQGGDQPVNTFSKTRAAAQYAARHAASDLTRSRAAVLLRRLNVCEAALAGTNGQLPVTVAGLLRSLVLAVRDLVGKTWLDASGDDPDVAAFTALEATASSPDAARIDQICAAVLWARFAPGGPAPASPASEEGGIGHAH